MKKYFQKANRDKNEPKITQVLDLYHIEYSAGGLGDGYDLLVQLPVMELWEVKNPEVKPSDRQLTDAEKRKQAYCKEMGIPYRVIEYSDQAVDAIAAALSKRMTA